MRTFCRCLCLMMLGAALPLHAHLDTLSQVINPDPLVKSFEAEALPTLGTVKPLDDAQATGGKAVVLQGPGAGFKLDFGDLPIGMHVVFVAGKVTQADAIQAGARMKQLLPLYVHLRVNSGPGGAWETHRLRVPFTGDYEYLAKLYFHTPEARAYQAEVTLGERSLVNELIVDRVELRNPLAPLTFAPVKTKVMIYTPAERRQMLVSDARANRLPAPLRPQELPPEAQAARDAILWDAVLPLNANPAGIYSEINRAPEGHGKVFAAAEAKAGRKLGAWASAYGRTEPYDQPWRLVNQELGLEYTLADYQAGKPLPAPWPFPEDKGGYFYPAQEGLVDKPYNLGTIPQFMQYRYHAVLAALGATPQWQTTATQLPQRYFLLGDLGAASDAALLLAAFAYRYPSYDYNLLCWDNVVVQYRTFDVGHGYGRGCSYEGWSTGEIADVIRAYDMLFPYIQGNQQLAQRIGRFVPWVKSPDDVLALIDTFLVQRAAQDALTNVLYPYVLPVAATVLGPGPVGERYLKSYFTRIYLRDTLSGFVDSLVGGYSRDGTNYIGSSFYVVGESKGELFDVADVLHRYARGGGNKAYDIADPVRYPRLAATADSLIRLHIAGGFRPGVGDVVDPDMEPRTWVDPKEDGEFLLRSWRWTGDRRAAWLMANLTGQGTTPDDEWAKIQAAAAAERSPIVHTASTVLEGYGTAHLEEGTDSADLRHKNAMLLRFGMGSGHAHSDTLDLEVYAHGVRMSSDLGGRPSGAYGHPNCLNTHVHNLVEVDERSHNGGTAINATSLGWLLACKPMPGAQFVQGEARAESHPQVALYRRGALQVLADPGDGAKVTPSAYIFDVFRVAGGKVHTWCFHGSVSDDFTTNATLAPAASELAKKYLDDHAEPLLEGAAPAALQATWRLRRTEEEANGAKLRNSEKRMLGTLYDEAAPRKFTRVTLFGHEGAKVMSGQFYARGKRQFLFPLLYVREEAAQEGQQQLFPALIDPYAGEPTIVSAKPLPVPSDKAQPASRRAVAYEVQTRFGQTDYLYADLDATGVISRDAQGLRLAHLIGGTMLAHGGITVTAERAAYQATIKSADYAKQTIALSEAWPGALLAGDYLTIANDLHASTYQAATVADAKVTLRRQALTYQGGVEAVVDGAAVLDLAPYLYGYHPGYYQGMTLTNEAGRVLGRAKMSQGDRFWYTGWPEVRRHLAIIKPEDLADANGDGKRTLTMIARDTQRKFGPDGTTVVEVKAGEPMLELEVTRVREDGLMFWTKQHPRDYLDSMNMPHAGWPYHQQTIRNEKGDKQWIVNMPGDTVRLGLQDRPLTDGDLADPDKDGRRMLYLQDYGPGDSVSVKTHVYLRRLQPGTFELRANVACTVTLPGQGASLSTDGGQTWQELPTEATTGAVKATLGLAQLGQGTVQLRVQ